VKIDEKQPFKCPFCRKVQDIPEELVDRKQSQGMSIFNL
jgi:hypothetical protein